MVNWWSSSLWIRRELKTAPWETARVEEKLRWHAWLLLGKIIFKQGMRVKNWPKTKRCVMGQWYCHGMTRIFERDRSKACIEDSYMVCAVRVGHCHEACMRLEQWRVVKDTGWNKRAWHGKAIDRANERSTRSQKPLGSNG